MIQKLLRLFLILIIIISYWYIYPWYTISYSIFSVTLTIDYLIYLIIILYLLLEYRVYTNDNNEFYHFFFWFIIIVVVTSLYITIIQAFIFIPKEFLVFTEIFKIQITYSTQYFLFRLYKLLDLLTNPVGLSDPTFVYLYKALFDSIYFHEVICSVKTLDDLNQLVESSKFICFNTLAKSKYIITYYNDYYKEQDLMLFKAVRNTLLFGIILKITCYTIPKLVFFNLSSFLLLYIFYKPYGIYTRHLLELTFNLQMAPLEFLDFNIFFRAWLLKNYVPGEILEAVINYYLS